MPDDTNVYWGGELDPAKLEKWLNSSRHDDDFLVRTDGDVEPGTEGGVFVSPREYSGEITAGNTKPRPFKMVRESVCYSKLHEREYHIGGYHGHYVYHC